MNTAITATPTPVLTGPGCAQPELQTVPPDQPPEPDPNRVTTKDLRHRRPDGATLLGPHLNTQDPEEHAHARHE